MADAQLLPHGRRQAGDRHLKFYDCRDNPPGFPDYVFARNGQVLFRELKTQHGRVTIGQRNWGIQLGGHGSIR